MAEELRVIVGLGNPGLEYRGHRHNVGFLAVEALAGKHGWSWKGAGDFAWSGGSLGSGPVVLVKPLTYMNRSGQPLLAWATEAAVELTGVPLAEPSPEDSEKQNQQNQALQRQKTPNLSSQPLPC